MARKTSVSGLRASVLSALNEYSGYVTAETKKGHKESRKGSRAGVKEEISQRDRRVCRKLDNGNKRNVQHHPYDSLCRRSSVQPYASSGKWSCQTGRRASGGDPAH